MSSVPVLKLRKDIWSHFPVCLVRLASTSDNRERYAVQWHKKNLSDWSQQISNYEEVTKNRLMQALYNCDRWEVGLASSTNDICIIIMNPPRQTMQPQLPIVHLPNIYANDKTIDSISDLRSYFPVCWRRKGERYIVDFHKTDLRALSQYHMISEDQLKSYISHALIQSIQNKWRILPGSTASEVCQLVA
jgi:hypothetical protein